MQVELNYFNLHWECFFAKLKFKYLFSNQEVDTFQFRISSQISAKFQNFKITNPSNPNFRPKTPDIHKTFHSKFQLFSFSPLHRLVRGKIRVKSGKEFPGKGNWAEVEHGCKWPIDRERARGCGPSAPTFCISPAFSLIKPSKVTVHVLRERKSLRILLGVPPFLPLTRLQRERERHVSAFAGIAITVMAGAFMRAAER